MPLIGEKQEEDRKMIAELVTRRMTACIRPRSISDTQSHTRNSQSYFPINNPNSRYEQVHKFFYEQHHFFTDLFEMCDMVSLKTAQMVEW